METKLNMTTEDLKKLLKSKMNEYSMLNDSLLEMFERNSSFDVINGMKNAMGETEADIKNLQRSIEEKIYDERGDGVGYSLYDKIRKQDSQDETTN